MICPICENNETKQNRRICDGCYTKVRRYRTKIAAIQLLGGKCAECGWTGNIATFDFHHKNPEEKEFNINKIAMKSWHVVKIELKKCELLCANCHRVKHVNNQGEKFLEIVFDYKKGNGRIDELAELVEISQV